MLVHPDHKAGVRCRSVSTLQSPKTSLFDSLEQPGGARSDDPETRLRNLHVRFLSYGRPTIPLVRDEVVGEGGSLF